MQGREKRSMDPEHQQRLDALAQGNAIRSRRAKALQKLRKGKLSPQQVLDHPDLQGIVVERLLRNIPFTSNPITRQALRRIHPGGRRARIARAIATEGNTRLQYLSERQRELLLEELRDLPMFRCY
jgi:hypothetical protein